MLRHIQKPVFLIFSGLTLAIIGGFFLAGIISARVEASRFVARMDNELAVVNSSFSGESAVIIKDLRNQKIIISTNAGQQYAAASMIKLPLMAVIFKAVDEGRLSLNQEFVFRRADITGGSGVIKGMGTPVSLSLKKIMECMITESDNTASNKIINTLGFDYINSEFRSLGLTGTVLRRRMMDFSGRKRGVENYTTASDLSFLLEKIYNKELINQGASEIMLSFLKRQKINDRLPLYLPKECVCAHKTGLERGVVHDAGIVFSNCGNYIICVLTKDVKDYKTAKKYIARLSLCAFDIYQNKRAGLGS
jgi:beta-lactamase class A